MGRETAETDRERNAGMQQRRGNEAIQTQRLRGAEMQQRRGNETTESRSIEETKGQTPDLKPSGSGMKAVVRYDRDTRFWEENRDYLESSARVNEAVHIRDHNEKYIQHRQRDAELQQRRSRETESEYEWCGSRINEGGPISESYIRENQQQQQHRPRDFRMQQRRSHETEWRFQQQQKRARDPDWRGSQDWGYKRRFDEMRHEQELFPRTKKGDCHFYLEKGWCGYGSDCVFNHPTLSGWRFDEGTQRRHEFDEGTQGSGSTWRFDEEWESGYGEDTLEQRQRDNIWWQRTEAPENMREQRDSTGWLSHHEREKREEQRRRG